MSAEENKAAVRQVCEEIFTRGNLEPADDLFLPTFVDHFPNPQPGQPINGPEAVRWYASRLRDAFPDMRVTIEFTMTDGDYLALRATWQGTHRHQFGYVPPTGRHIQVEAIDMVRFENGKIAEHWGGWNFADVLQQLGGLPEPYGSPD